MQASPSVRIGLLDRNGNSINAGELVDPISLRFTVDRNVQQLADIVDGIHVHKTQTEERAIRKGEVECLHLDEGGTGAFVKEGCEVVGISEEAIKCECRRVSTILVFVKASYEVILNSNYQAIARVSELQLAELNDNYGFRFSLAFCLSYILFSVISALTDKRALADKTAAFLEKELS